MSVETENGKRKTENTPSGLYVGRNGKRKTENGKREIPHRGYMSVETENGKRKTENEKYPIGVICR
ncbi:MAG: hypothetical protein IJL44_07535 [Bacteroidales bacterium]|nr:hypothetical protein [Bacteroidales bacterium]